MATELTFTVWTNQEVDGDVAHALAATLTSAAKNAGDTTAQVVNTEIRRIEPQDITDAVAEQNARDLEEAFDAEAAEEELIGESGYAYEDEGHDPEFEIELED